MSTPQPLNLLITLRHDETIIIIFLYKKKIVRIINQFYFLAHVVWPHDDKINLLDSRVSFAKSMLVFFDSICTNSPFPFTCRVFKNPEINESSYSILILYHGAFEVYYFNT